MLLLIGGVGRLGPRYKMRNKLDNNSKDQLVEKVAQFPTSKQFPTRTKY